MFSTNTPQVIALPHKAQTAQLRLKQLRCKKPPSTQSQVLITTAAAETSWPLLKPVLMLPAPGMPQVNLQQCKFSYCTAFHTNQPVRYLGRKAQLCFPMLVPKQLAGHKHTGKKKQNTQHLFSVRAVCNDRTNKQKIPRCWYTNTNTKKCYQSIVNSGHLGVLRF